MNFIINYNSIYYETFFYPFLILITFNFSEAFAQSEIPNHIKEKITYPVFDFHPWVGVVPVANGSVW